MSRVHLALASSIRFSDLCQRAAATIRQRVTEAGLTTGLETLLVFYGFRNGLFNILHPNGYTKGWAIIGQAVEQWQFGVFLLIFAALRGPCVLFAGYRPRFVFAFIGLYVSLTVDVMIRKANPDSPMIPTQDVLAATNAWIAVSLIGKEWGITFAEFWEIVFSLLRGRRRADP